VHFNGKNVYFAILDLWTTHDTWPVFEDGLMQNKTRKFIRSSEFGEIKDATRWMPQLKLMVHDRSMMHVRDGATGRLNPPNGAFPSSES
jgi:hypothetical protein